MADTNDEKLLSEFRKLINFCAADAAYNPPNPRLQTAALETQYDAGVAAVHDVTVQIVPYKVAVNTRQDGYAGIAGFAKSIRQMAKVSGAGAPILADMQTYIRKLQGSRAGKKPEDNPDTPQNEAENAHSVAQLTYESRAGNFRQVVELAKGEPSYSSNEPEFKTNALTAKADSLDSFNEDVAAQFVPLSNSRAGRDRLLYLNADNMVDTALLVKNYVEANRKNLPTLYSQIRSLRFPRKRSRS